jgi:hypothetical protein
LLKRPLVPCFNKRIEHSFWRCRAFENFNLAVTVNVVGELSEIVRIEAFLSRLTIFAK